MSSDLGFRLVEGDAATSAELERTLELLHAAFTSWPGKYRLSVPDIDHLRWKLDGPTDRPSALTFAELDGKIVSVVVYQPARMLVEGQPRLARYGTENAMDPAYQGRGLYSKRSEYAKTHWDPLFDFSFSVTHNPKVLHWRQRRGTPPLQNPLRVLRRAYDVRRLAEADPRARRSRLRALLYAPGVRALSIGMRLLHRPRALAAPSWSIRESRAFDERADEFAKRAAEQFDMIQLRDRRFLNWRYFDPRTPNSVVWVAEDGGEMLGYVAYRTEGADGYLMDLLALPGRLDVAHSLASQADRALRQSGVMAASCWIMQRHPYVPVLKAYGFIPSRFPTGFSFRGQRLQERELVALRKPKARIHYTLADLDVV